MANAGKRPWSGGKCHRHQDIIEWPSATFLHGHSLINIEALKLHRIDFFFYEVNYYLANQSLLSNHNYLVCMPLPISSTCPLEMVIPPIILKIIMY